jgi:hypothetical protein
MCRIRISALDEVIPVTRERVCTIIGTLPAVLLAQKLISGALVENAKTQVEEAADRRRSSRKTRPRDLPPG